MQMERCANAWKKERPGSQAAEELGERTRASTMGGTRTPIQFPPTQVHFSVYPEPGLQGLGANYSLSVPTPMPVSVMMNYICGPPSPGSEPNFWLVGAAGKVRSMRFGCVQERREDASSIGGGPSVSHFRHLLISGARKMECTGSFSHLSNPSWRPRLQTPVLLPERID